jgi:hypothetical protein
MTDVPDCEKVKIEENANAMKSGCMAGNVYVCFGKIGHMHAATCTHHYSLPCRQIYVAPTATINYIDPHLPSFGK